MQNSIKVVVFSFLIILLHSCSGNFNSDKITTKDNSVIFDYPFSLEDTVRRTVITFSDSYTFEGTVQQSLIKKDFSGITKYMDSTVLFAIDYNNNTLQKMTARSSVVNAINNIISSVEYIDYKFYKAPSKTNPDSILYILSITALYNETETDIGIMFIMNKEIITAVKLY
jgi:hypothetical protein